ncbi:hypothetical protein HGRIS_006441 [Hohenbuehelia grisea]|uniref:Major facilitator superfamily (MFS) profile domain-containing protein n=1 Tax=Hohenbuehelia grisea TaxID=104357 RepID=A0ABR3K176_9AGAR
MASVTPRASGFWEATNRMPSNYFPDDDDSDDFNDLDTDQRQRLIHDDEEQQMDDGRTRLDKTIDRIGMGSYQWTLLSLCGFGWLADNMWIQAIAIILPRVQRHYSVPDSYIGTVSASMFAGMMFGAIGWGTCSDLLGRSAAFNATLFFTALFGLLASFTKSFTSLCVVLFFLGSSVGGSMPTDGTLLLEHMPKGKQYLVTALSVFFSVGAVLAAIVALLVLPQNSCLAEGPCDVNIDNNGWKHLLMAIGLLTLGMFIARMVFFRLHESPRYLVHAGRPQEALESLQMISRFNGSDLTLELEDVDDHHPATSSPDIGRGADRDKDESPRSTGGTSEIVFDAESGQARQVSSPSPPVASYHATGESNAPLGSHLFSSSPEQQHLAPSLEDGGTYRKEQGLLPSISTQRDSVSFLPEGTAGQSNPSTPSSPSRPRPRPSMHSRQGTRMSTASARSRRRSSFYENNKACAKLPRWLRKPLWAWLDRVGMVLSPSWRRTTLLVWAAWCSMSLAYTMFNVFLPKLLESSPAAGALAGAKSLQDSLWDVVIFTIGGCPGAILGAYMVESSLGRKWSLAGSTFVTAVFCAIFVGVESTWAVRATTVGISLSATTMWAVLYGWTPEIFGTKVRGTACGIASALSRIGGMIAPMLGGILLMINRSIPVYTSVVIFAFAGVCVLLLREGERGKGVTAALH